MEVTFDSWNNYIHFDLVSQRVGGSAVLQPGDDPVTEVIYGGLYARVVLHDLKILITMDSHKGEWQNPRWARQRSLEVLKENLAREDFLNGIGRAIQQAMEAGRCEGAKQARAKIRSALGIEEMEEGWCDEHT